MSNFTLKVTNKLGKHWLEITAIDGDHEYDKYVIPTDDFCYYKQYEGVVICYKSGAHWHPGIDFEEFEKELSKLSIFGA